MLVYSLHSDDISISMIISEMLYMKNLLNWRMQVEVVMYPRIEAFAT